MPVIHTNGIDLYYEIAGAGPPLLLIHGLGSSSRDWELQTAAFAPAYQVITFDLRGHGRSQKPAGPYSIPLFAGDAQALWQALSIAPAHVVGLSLGGAVAFQLAVDAPHMVKTLTIVNSAPAWVPRSLSDRMKIWQRMAIVRLLGMRKMGEVLSKRLFIKPEQADIRQVFVERWAENDPVAYRAAMRALFGWSVADHLPTITCPALVIAADEDYTPVALKQAYTSQMPNARLAVIPDSRHATPVEQPEAFNQALSDFLAAHNH